jgi:hypothetical protein
MKDISLLEQWLFENYKRVVDSSIDEDCIKVLVKFAHNNSVNLSFNPDEIISTLNSTLVCFVIYPQLLEEHEQYIRRLVEIFKSVMNQTNVPYWDDNLFGIISNYTCMPYF